MYVKGKMIPAEIIPGMVEDKMKENDGGSEFKYDVGGGRQQGTG
jgi:hypothetical protein